MASLIACIHARVSWGTTEATAEARTWRRSSSSRENNVEKTMRSSSAAAFRLVAILHIARSESPSVHPNYGMGVTDVNGK